MIKIILVVLTVIVVRLHATALVRFFCELLYMHIVFILFLQWPIALVDETELQQLCSVSFYCDTNNQNNFLIGYQFYKDFINLTSFIDAEINFHYQIKRNILQGYLDDVNSNITICLQNSTTPAWATVYKATQLQMYFSTTSHTVGSSRRLRSN